MADAGPAELRDKVLDQIDDGEVVRLACELIRAEPEHFGVRLPQSYAGNDTTHLWAAFLCTRVLALTALEATR